MDYVVLTKHSQVLGYVVNSGSQQDAEKMAKRASHEWEKGYTVEPCSSKGVPDLFANCFFDPKTLESFLKANPVKG